MSSNDVAIANPAALFDELFEKRSNLPVMARADRVEAYRRLDDIGKAAVLELIASGRLPNEIAIEAGVPITFFWDWLDERTEPQELARARQLCAESFMLKSILPLTVSFDSPGHASMARALSDRMATIAERLDPSRWAPSRGGDKQAPAVTLIFENVGSDIKLEAGPQVIEGEAEESKDEVLEALKTLDYIVGEEDG